MAFGVNAGELGGGDFDWEACVGGSKSEMSQAPLDFEREWFEVSPPAIRSAAATLICAALIEIPPALDKKELREIPEFPKEGAGDVNAAAEVVVDTVHGLLESSGDSVIDGVRALRFRAGVDFALGDMFDPVKQVQKRELMQRWYELARSKGDASNLEQTLRQWDFTSAQMDQVGRWLESGAHGHSERRCVATCDLPQPFYIASRLTRPPHHRRCLRNTIETVGGSRSDIGGIFMPAFRPGVRLMQEPKGEYPRASYGRVSETPGIRAARGDRSGGFNQQRDNASSTIGVAKVEPVQ